MIFLLITFLAIATLVLLLADGRFDKVAEPSDIDLVNQSHNTLTHMKCLISGKCQETEGFKGTEHEGLDMCEDGCVLYDPRTHPDYKSPRDGENNR